MVGLFLKQVSPEFLLMEPWVLFSQTLCIKNYSLARNGAKGSTAAHSSPLLGLPAYFSIFRMRCKASCSLIAFSLSYSSSNCSFPLHLQVLQSGARTVPRCRYPSPMTNNLCPRGHCPFSSWDLEPCTGEGGGYGQKIALGEARVDLALGR